jgi:hypothetical protein
MEELLQTFDAPFTDGDGEIYDVQLFGRSRPEDTWQGWLVFSRRRDGRSFSTDVETTQSSAEGILHWASGLSRTHFDGAFARARRPLPRRTSARPVPPPLVDARSDHATYANRLTTLESDILEAFARHRIPQLSTKALLDELPYAHADTVRALEDLEKQRRLLVRRTEGGNDWLLLTEEGLGAAGLSAVPHEHDVVEIEPPKSVP